MRWFTFSKRGNGPRYGQAATARAFRGGVRHDELGKSAERHQSQADRDPTSKLSGSAVLYLTCLRAKLDRMLATPRAFESRSMMKCWSSTVSRTTTRKR